MYEQLFGYVRVSTKEQNEDRQVIAMKEFGVPHENILIEKMSGKDFNRPIYKKLINKLKPEDTLVIKSIDRLGRNYNEIIEEWRYITKEIGAYIAVIDLPLLDTRRKERGLIDTFMSDLFLQTLGYVSEQEVDLCRQRQAEGIAAAKARGVRFGSSPKERPAAFESIKTLWLKKEITAREAARQLNISHSTFLIWVKEPVK